MKKFTLFLLSLLLVSTFANAATINCANSAELIAALSSFADGDEIVLTTSGGVYIVVDNAAADVVTGSAATQAITDKAINIHALAGLEAKPIVKGMSLKVAYSTNVKKDITLEGIIFEGSVVYWTAVDSNVARSMTDHLIDLGNSASTTYGNITIRNCEMRNYNQRCIKGNSLGANSIGESFLVINSIFHDINTIGLTGTNYLFDCDKIAFKSVDIKQNTFYNNNQGIYNTGQNIPMPGIDATVNVSNNTFYKAFGKQGSGNAFMFQFRYNTANQNITGTFLNNLISEPFYNFPQIASSNVVLHYFNFGSSNANAFANSSNNLIHGFDNAAMDIFSPTAVIIDFNGNGNANNLNVPTANRTTSNILPEYDPLFVDAANGNFNYQSTAVRDLATTIGDPRWTYSTGSGLIKSQLEDVIISVKSKNIIISGKNISCKIYDVTGKNVYTSIALDVHSAQLSKGVYFIEAINQNGFYKTKILIK